MPGAAVREPIERDFPAWSALYHQYCSFYEVPFDEALAATVWGWLTDGDHPLEGLIAVADDQPVGLAHYRAHPVPLFGRYGGYLDDLFVDPEHRGQGVVDALMARLSVIARDRDWVAVSWSTADDNYRARAVYDRVASRTAWITYEMEPGSDD